MLRLFQSLSSCTKLKSRRAEQRTLRYKYISHYFRIDKHNRFCYSGSASMAARLVKKNFMGVRKSPERTPTFLAAHRRNPQKCTDTRTPEGKALHRPVLGEARSLLNALKHGRFAWMKTRSRKTNNLARRRRGAKPSKASKGVGISILCTLAALRESVWHFLAQRGTNPTFFRNETGISFRFSIGGLLSFFVPFFTGTKLECLLESIKARGSNPISRPNFVHF